MTDGVRAGRNFDAMVRPLAPFALRGVLWYQGESQVICCDDGLRYADRMLALIRGWRAAWGRGDLPFYYAQIAPFVYAARKDRLAHTAEDLPRLWEGQAAALRIPHTGMIPTTDLVEDVRDIHPGRKREVGRRLANLALAKTYGRRKLIYTGPTFRRMEARGPKAVVRFDNTGGRLASRGGGPLTEFEVAGAAGEFVPAEALIRGATVVVSSPRVAEPKAVRYGWREDARPNLVNRAGLPAYPFRTNSPVWVFGR